MGILASQVCVSLRHLLVVSMAIVSVMGLPIESKCAFHAIFNFGDSNSDTGSFSAAFPKQEAPYGMTYFKKPTGRASDGRLMIDFLAQALGLPFLSPYLQSIGSDFRHGANFAQCGATINLPEKSQFAGGPNTFALGIQVTQMVKGFKVQVDENQHKGLKNIPKPNIFSKSLYTFNIGHNDLGSLIGYDISSVKENVTQLLSQTGNNIKEMYKLGGRTALVFSISPLGCLPSAFGWFSPKESDLDPYGCMFKLNNFVVEYSRMLKDKVRELRQTLPDFNVIYVDIYSVLVQLYQHPKFYGLQYGTKACCGYGGGSHNFNKDILCASEKNLNGTIVKATNCEDPQNYVSWDGIHATEAANKLVMKAIVNGSYFDPPFPLHQLCDLHPIN